MPRSEASRQKDRDRMARWRKENPDRARRNTRLAWKNYAAKAAARRALRRFSPQEIAQWYQTGLSIVGKRSPLVYIDAHGHVHHEKELSAEELIRRHERSKRRGKKTTAEEAPQTTSSPPQATSPSKATSH